MRTVCTYTRKDFRGKPLLQRIRMAWEYSRESWTMFLFFGIYMTSFTFLERVNRLHYTVIHMALDDSIPFVEQFVIPYFLWFPFIIFNVAYFYFYDRRTYHNVASTLIMGMSVMIIVSIVFPNIQYLRPEVMPRDNIFTRMVTRLYAGDTPTNICPSIHVYNTLCILAGLAHGNQYLAKCRAYRWPMNILGILIILSTMFIKQHSVLDVVCAFIMMACTYVLVYRYDIILVSRKRRETLLDA